MISISEPKKIAVVRANALGDYVFVLPALQALRERFPDAEIVYFGKAWHKEYLEGRPGPVDRVIVVPPYPGVGEREDFAPDEQQLNGFFAAMEKEEFDLAFQLHGGGRYSNPFLLRLGAKMTVGLKTPDAADLDISVPYVYYFSEILRYLEVVAKVGARTTAIEPEIATTAEDLEEAKAVIKEPDRPVAVIHPGASDLRRHWPAENFAQVADYLADKGYQVYITGSPFEREVIERLLDHARRKDELIALCGKLSLGGMTGLLSLADVLISNDTGPLHLARALKTPNVGVYWCGNNITGIPMSSAINRSIPSFQFECPLCRLSAKKFGTAADAGTCKHQTSFVTDISVEEVITAADELIALTSKERRAAAERQSAAA